MFQVGQRVWFEGKVRTVTMVIRSDIAPSGYLVECDAFEEPGHIYTAERTGLVDASRIEPLPQGSEFATLRTLSQLIDK